MKFLILFKIVISKKREEEILIEYHKIQKSAGSQRERRRCEKQSKILSLHQS